VAAGREAPLVELDRVAVGDRVEDVLVPDLIDELARDDRGTG